MVLAGGFRERLWLPLPRRLSRWHGIATLFITPVYYSLTDSVASRLSGLFKKIKLPKFNFHKKNPQQ